MPVAPTILVQNFESGAALGGVFPEDADGPLLDPSKYLQMAGGQILHTLPITDGGTIPGPSDMAFQLSRRMSGRGLYSQGNDQGGFNQFGYTVSQLTVAVPGVTGTVIELVNDYSDPGEVLAEALTTSPLPDGVAKRFRATLVNSSVLVNTLRLSASSGEVFVDDGNGVLVRYNAKGEEEQTGPGAGYVDYGVGPLPTTSEVVIMFEKAPVAGTTIEADYWWGQASVATPIYDPATDVPAKAVDNFVWGRGRADGPILVSAGQYIRVVAAGAAASAGSITAVVGGAMPRGMGTNVYGFAQRKRG